MGRGKVSRKLRPGGNFLNRKRLGKKESESIDAAFQRVEEQDRAATAVAAAQTSTQEGGAATGGGEKAQKDKAAGYMGVIFYRESDLRGKDFSTEGRAGRNQLPDAIVSSGRVEAI